MNALDRVKKHLKPGQVYRRSDLSKWSSSVDRHLKELVDTGVLKKVSTGVYSYPKKASFGKVPAEDAKLVKAFLKSDDFLLVNPNSYNGLGIGTTQLYNEQVVYNRKRHGKFTLDGRVFDFRVKPYFPKTLSKEFLLVDLVNNVKNLAEDQKMVIENVSRASLSVSRKKLSKVAEKYGSVRAKKILAANSSVMANAVA
jgi:hypothetical protein